MWIFRLSEWVSGCISRKCAGCEVSYVWFLCAWSLRSILTGAASLPFKMSFWLDWPFAFSSVDIPFFNMQLKYTYFKPFLIFLKWNELYKAWCLHGIFLTMFWGKMAQLYVWLTAFGDGQNALWSIVSQPGFKTQPTSHPLCNFNQLLFFKSFTFLCKMVVRIVVRIKWASVALNRMWRSLDGSRNFCYCYLVGGS